MTIGVPPYPHKNTGNQECSRFAIFGGNEGLRKALPAQMQIPQNLHTQEISLTSTTKLALRATALAAFAMVSASAFADFDANIEFDNKIENNARGASQAGRVEFNASKKAGSKYFIAGKASFLAHPDGSVGADDLWVQMGGEMADIKLGRFEAANLFQTPGDVIVEYAGFSPYQANALRGRQGGVTVVPNSGAASYGAAVFHAAGTLQLGGGLSFELSGVSSKGTGQVNGLRPVLNYGNGPLHIAAGLETMQYQTGNMKRETGFGLTGDYDFGGFTLLANYATVKSDMGLKRNTFALMGKLGQLTLASVFGADKQAVGGDAKVSTFWAAYAMPFFDVQGATITPAVSFSKGSGANTAKDSSGASLRVNYAF
jgi:hypothetical protein